MLNLAAVGFVQPVSVRLRGDEPVIVDGVQRVKRALIINAVVGASYTGHSVDQEAIIRLSVYRLIAGKRIIELSAKGVKVPIIVHRGKEGRVRCEGLGQRVPPGRPIIEKARKAQQLNTHGHDAADIAAMFRVSRRHREALAGHGHGEGARAREEAEQEHAAYSGADSEDAHGSWAGMDGA